MNMNSVKLLPLWLLTICPPPQYELSEAPVASDPLPPPPFEYKLWKAFVTSNPMPPPEYKLC